MSDQPDDCCPGEPCMGDPRGMHSDDCPVYLAFVAAWEAARPKPAPRVAQPLARAWTIADVTAAYERGKAEQAAEVERLTLLLEHAEQYARDLQDDGVLMPDRDTAKASIHPALHDLDVRINNLDVGDCHCNLVAEVILDALYGRAAEGHLEAGHHE